MADPFAEVKAQLNKDADDLAEDTGSQWEAGDLCGEGGCTHTVHEIHHPRGDSEIPSHESYSEHEFVCVHHGIVATR